MTTTELTRKIRDLRPGDVTPRYEVLSIPILEGEVMRFEVRWLDGTEPTIALNHGWPNSKVQIARERSPGVFEPQTAEAFAKLESICDVEDLDTARAATKTIEARYASFEVQVSDRVRGQLVTRCEVAHEALTNLLIALAVLVDDETAQEIIPETVLPEGL